MFKTLMAAIEAELANIRKRASALAAALAAMTDGAANAAQPKPGDRMPDGTVYVGISPTDGRPLYAMPHDLPHLHSWASAKTAAAAQTFAGHTDWRVPTIAELSALYSAREVIGGFRHPFQRDWYWSSSESDSAHARAQNFLNGHQTSGLKVAGVHVRCVRSG
jgi:hypothetical protein